MDMIMYMYLVCKRKRFGGLTPLKMFTSLDAAREFANNLGNRYVIFKQKRDFDMEEVTNQED